MIGFLATSNTSNQQKQHPSCSRFVGHCLLPCLVRGNTLSGSALLQPVTLAEERNPLRIDLFLGSNLGTSQLLSGLPKREEARAAGLPLKCAFQKKQKVQSGKCHKLVPLDRAMKTCDYQDARIRLHKHRFQGPISAAVCLLKNHLAVSWRPFSPG